MIDIKAIATENTLRWFQESYWWYNGIVQNKIVQWIK